MRAQARDVVLALDWTPNTNHTGFYVALCKGLYTAKGINLRIISTHEDEYKGSYGENGTKGEYVTPCSKVAEKTATFALNSPEGVVGWNSPTLGAKKDKPKLKCIAAVLQKQTSAIVTLQSSGITSPAQLDGKIYASYAARYEGRIVQRMIEYAGGEGNFKESTPPMLGIWNTLLEGKADATWVFLGWEGVEAKLRNVRLNVFRLQDYDIPYGYAPCLVAHPDTLSNSPELVKDFLEATAEGFKFAVLYPEEAADILITGAKDHNNFEIDTDLALESQKWLGPSYLNEKGMWGVMTEQRWQAYIDWLSHNGLLTTLKQSRKPKRGQSASLDDLREGNVGDPIPKEQFPPSLLYTNEFLPTDGYHNDFEDELTNCSGGKSEPGCACT